MKTLCALLPLLLLPLVPRTAQDDASDAPEPPAFLESLGPRLVDVTELDAPSAGARDRVAKAVGQDASLTEGARLFDARTRPARGARKPVRICRLPLPAESPAAAVLLAIDDEGRWSGGAVLDEGGAAVEEWKRFLSVVAFRPVPRLATARPRAHVEEVRKNSLIAKAAEERLPAALIEMLEAMQTQAAVMNVPTGPDGLPARELVVGMRDAYARAAELAVPLAPMLGEKAERFSELARESSEDAAAMLAALDSNDGEGDQEALRTAQRAVMQRCHSCHDLPGPDGEELKAAFPARRAELDIGDGYYIVGFDLRIAHADREAAQEIADGLRRAALLIDASR